MARTLTSAALTETGKQTGAFPRRVLELQLSGGSVYYATEAFEPTGLGVTTAARVLSWGDLQLQSEAGTIGGHGQLTVRLRDEDLALKTIFDAKPGVQNVHAYVHLWFSGTNWSDRVTIFGGILSAPFSWDTETAAWSVTMKGFEHYFDTDLGQVLDREQWPEVMCDGECEGSLIPIVYGSPCVRVPACVIDRPGTAKLGAYLGIHDATLTIHRTAGSSNFTTGENINLIVGWPGNFELINGYFDDDSDTTFTILNRGAIQAAGSSPGVFASGERYFLLDREDLVDTWTGNTINPDQSRVGWPIYVDNDADGNWVTFTVDHWFHTGFDQGVVREPAGITFKTGAIWKLARWPSDVYWLTGAPVFEIGSWTYACNFLPSTSVTRVEAKAEVDAHDSRGSRVTQFFQYDASRYSVTLNDKSYNAKLGRDAGADGITTITLDAPPPRYGVTDERIWVTQSRLSTAGEIIEDLLTSDALGGIDSGMVNSMTDSTSLAFAITESGKKLNDVVADLAQQAGALLFWDGGKATLRSLSNTLDAGDNELTVTPANYAGQSLKIEAVPVANLPTEMAAKMKTSLPAPELQLLRTSSEAAGEYGRRRKALSLWGIQDIGTASSVTEFWLTYYLQRNRIVSFRAYLGALHLQPGDTITLDIDTGNGTVIFDSVLARVLSLRHIAGEPDSQRMESIEVTCEVKLWDWTIQSVANPQEEDCEEPLPEPDFYDPELPASKETTPNRPGIPHTPNTPKRPTGADPPQFSSSSSSGESSSEGDSGFSDSVASSSGSSSLGSSSSGSSGSAGESSSGECHGIPGLNLASLPVSMTPDSILAIEDGCLVVVGVTECPADSSSGGSSGS